MGHVAMPDRRRAEEIAGLERVRERAAPRTTALMAVLIQTNPLDFRLPGGTRRELRRRARKHANFSEGETRGSEPGSAKSGAA